MVTPRINPTVTSISCSKTGRTVETNGFGSPFGLCSCCPAPGKPLLVHYDRARVAQAWAVDRTRSSGLFRFAAGVPVVGLPADYAVDVGETPVVRHERL